MVESLAATRWIIRLHELHLGACQLRHIAVLEGDGFAARGLAIHRGAGRTFDVRKDVTIRTLGDKATWTPGLPTVVTTLVKATSRPAAAPLSTG